MYEPVITLLSTALVTWQPGESPPMRTGSRVPGGVPRNTYRTGDDRWVVLSGPTDPQVGARARGHRARHAGGTRPVRHVAGSARGGRRARRPGRDLDRRARPRRRDPRLRRCARPGDPGERPRHADRRPARAGARERAHCRRSRPRAGRAARTDGAVERHTGHRALAGPRPRGRHRRRDRRLAARAAE